MRRWMRRAVVVLAVALGSYALFAQQMSSATPGGNDGMMSGGLAGGMSGGMMGNMSCPGSGMMQAAIAATSDGGVIVAAAGKLIKYDAAFKKVQEVDLDIDWNAANQKMQQNGSMMK